MVVVMVVVVIRLWHYGAECNSTVIRWRMKWWRSVWRSEWWWWLGWTSWATPIVSMVNTEADERNTATTSARPRR